MRLVRNAMGRRHEAAVEEFVRRVEAADLPTVDRLVLFGSVARNDERDDSDVDVLAVLEEPDDDREVEEALRDVAYDVMLETGVNVSVHAVTADNLEARGDHPFFETVLAEGRPIYG